MGYSGPRRKTGAAGGAGGLSLRLGPEPNTFSGDSKEAARELLDARAENRLYESWLERYKQDSLLFVRLQDTEKGLVYFLTFDETQEQFESVFSTGDPALLEQPDQQLEVNGYTSRNEAETKISAGMDRDAADLFVSRATAALAAKDPWLVELEGENYEIKSVVVETNRAQASIWEVTFNGRTMPAKPTGPVLALQWLVTVDVTSEADAITIDEAFDADGDERPWKISFTDSGGNEFSFDVTGTSHGTRVDNTDPTNPVTINTVSFGYDPGSSTIASGLSKFDITANLPTGSFDIKVTMKYETLSDFTQFYDSGDWDVLDLDHTHSWIEVAGGGEGGLDSTLRVGPEPNIFRGDSKTAARELLDTRAEDRRNAKWLDEYKKDSLKFVLLEDTTANVQHLLSFDESTATKTSVFGTGSPTLPDKPNAGIRGLIDSGTQKRLYEIPFENDEDGVDALVAAGNAAAAVEDHWLINDGVNEHEVVELRKYLQRKAKTIWGATIGTRTMPAKPTVVALTVPGGLITVNVASAAIASTIAAAFDANGEDRPWTISFTDSGSTVRAFTVTSVGAQSTVDNTDPTNPVTHQQVTFAYNAGVTVPSGAITNFDVGALLPDGWYLLAIVGEFADATIEIESVIAAGDWSLRDLDYTHSWFEIAGGGAAVVPDATTSRKGKVELATVTEAKAGTSNELAVTPRGLKGYVDDAVADIDVETYSPDSVVYQMSADATIDLEDHWDDWKQRNVIIENTGSTEELTLTIRTDADGDWLPDKETESHVFAFTGAQFYPSTSTTTIEWANADAPEITKVAFLPATGRRYLKRVRVYTTVTSVRVAGTIEIQIIASRTDSSVVGDDLSSDFEANGKIAITVAGSTIEIDFANAAVKDNEEPYYITGANLQEIIDWSRALGTASTSSSGSVELKLVTDAAESEKGNFIKFIPNWDKCDIRLSQMAFARLNTSGEVEAVAKAASSKALANKEIPFTLRYTEDYSISGTEYNWFVEPAIVPGGDVDTSSFATTTALDNAISEVRGSIPSTFNTLGDVYDILNVRTFWIADRGNESFDASGTNGLNRRVMLVQGTSPVEITLTAPTDNPWSMQVVNLVAGNALRLVQIKVGSDIIADLPDTGDRVTISYDFTNSKFVVDKQWSRGQRDFEIIKLTADTTYTLSTKWDEWRGKTIFFYSDDYGYSGYKVTIDGFSDFTAAANKRVNAGHSVEFYPLFDPGQVLLKDMAFFRFGGDKPIHVASNSTGVNATTELAVPFRLTYQESTYDGTKAYWTVNQLSPHEGKSIVETVTVDTTYDLHEKWSEWKNKNVFFQTSAGRDPVVTIRPDMSGTWAPDREMVIEEFSLDDADFSKTSTTVRFQPASSSDRYQFQRKELLPSSGNRYFGRVELNSNGSVDVRIAHNTSEGLGTGNQDDMSTAFESGGRVTIETDEDTLSFVFGGSDPTEPYTFTPTNSAEVTAFVTKYSAKTNGSVAATIQFSISKAGVGDHVGDSIMFHPLWEGGRIEIEGMKFARHDSDGSVKGFQKSFAGENATEGFGEPFKLIYTELYYIGAETFDWHVAPLTQSVHNVIAKLNRSVVHYPDLNAEKSKVEYLIQTDDSIAIPYWPLFDVPSGDTWYEEKEDVATIATNSYKVEAEKGSHQIFFRRYNADGDLESEEDILQKLKSGSSIWKNRLSIRDGVAILYILPTTSSDVVTSSEIACIVDVLSGRLLHPCPIALDETVSSDSAVYRMYAQPDSETTGVVNKNRVSLTTTNADTANTLVLFGESDDLAAVRAVLESSLGTILSGATVSMLGEDRSVETFPVSAMSATSLATLTDFNKLLNRASLTLTVAAGSDDVVPTFSQYVRLFEDKGGVESWAREGSTETIPSSKIPLGGAAAPKGSLIATAGAFDFTVSTGTVTAGGSRTWSVENVVTADYPTLDSNAALVLPNAPRVDNQIGYYIELVDADNDDAVISAIPLIPLFGTSEIEYPLQVQDKDDSTKRGIVTVAFQARHATTGTTDQDNVLTVKNTLTNFDSAFADSGDLKIKVYETLDTAGSGTRMGLSGGAAGSVGSYDILRREENVTVSVSGTVIAVGGSNGYLVDEGATHLEVTITAPANLSQELTIYYVDPESDAKYPIYDDVGSNVRVKAGKVTGHRFSSAFFHEETDGNRLKLELRSEAAATGSDLELVLEHEKDVNSAAVEEVVMLPNSVGVNSQVTSTSFVGKTVSDVEFDIPVEYDQIVSLSIMVGTDPNSSNEAGFVELRWSIDVMNFIEEFGSSDSIASQAHCKGTFAIGWVGTGSDNEFSMWVHRPGSRYMSDQIGHQNAVGRFIGYYKEGVYLVGLRVASIHGNSVIQRVSCMRRK